MELYGDRLRLKTPLSRLANGNCRMVNSVADIAITAGYVSITVFQQPVNICTICLLESAILSVRMCIIATRILRVIKFLFISSQYYSGFAHQMGAVAC